MNRSFPLRKILILTANPKNTTRLRLDLEVREISEGLRLSKNRSQFDIQQEWAVRLKDLRRALLNHEPQIVHFCGHGASEGLFLEDDEGKAQLVPLEALSELFKLFKQKVICVLLSACYSETQAEAIARNIPYVIGMHQAVQDKTAIEFAVGFYDALGAGRTVEDAYKFGCNAIQMEGIPENLKPVLKNKTNRKQSPSPKPILPKISTADVSLRNWEEEDWSTLIYSIRQEKCVLMLGPDTAIDQTSGQNRSLTEQLANELAEKIKPQIDTWNLDPSNLAQIAQYYALEIGRNALEAKVSSFYEARWELSNELYRDLAALPFFFTLTTTPDNMWCEALRAENKEPLVECYNYRAGNPSMVRMGSVTHPLVYYLYGFTENPSSLVLTENDLLNFLVAVISKNPPLPHNVLSELRDPDKNLLFLGFGFKHWYLRILLHILQGKKESRSFALEQINPRNIAEFQSTILFYRRSDYKIHIYQQNLQEFVRALRTRYEEGLSNMLSKPRLQNAPMIFICHAPEDREYIQTLSQKLETAGFRTWKDTQRLRGGNTWNTLLEQIISESDYVLVLHSSTLCEQRKDYVEAEIRYALEYQMQYQMQFGPAIRFIIPVQIGTCLLLEELEQLQPFDLSDNEDMSKLISVIRRDQQRRHRN